MKPTEITNSAIAIGTEGMASDGALHSDLMPEGGLTPMFSTMAENIPIYWRVAVALGALAAVLASVGMWRLEPVPTDRLRASARLRSLALGGTRSDRPVPLDRP